MKASNYTKKIAMASVAAICVATATMGAHADEADAPTRTVRYADLNLNTPAGVSALYQRIRYAAEAVCDGAKWRGLAEATAAKACVDHAVSVSVHSVNNANLTKEYEAHLGKGEKAINVASAH
jgi:UrcA family protein